MTANTTVLRGMIGLGLVVGFRAADVQAEPNKVEYELSERCGKATADWFKSKWGTSETFVSGPQTTTYENHYNRKLNKCIVLLTNRFSGSDLILSLFDLNERITYGEFQGLGNDPHRAPEKCYVTEKQCRSEAEWRALVKPFMEE